MSWKDYIDNYKRTSVCINHDLVNYKHSIFYHDFRDVGMEQSIFKLYLEDDIDCLNETFALSIAQQGPRLKNYRIKDSSSKFEPIRFNMILLDHTGDIVGRYTSFKRFHQSIVVKDRKLPATPQGYYIYVKFEKNDSYDSNKDYSKVVLDVYSKKNCEIELVDFHQGAKAIGLE